MVAILKQSPEYDQVKVSVGKTAYDIFIGNVLGQLTDFVGNSKYRAVRVLTDQNVEKAGHLELVLDAIRQSGKKSSYGVLRAGEQFKHIKYFPEMIRAIDEPELDRKTLVVALGGGVIGDEVGFVAAAYLRGIDLVQMPTTPLSGADSSIGGKVGLDTDKGKNRVGAFKHPVAVFQHTPFFESFRNSPNRHYGYDSGWAETVKHAGIDDGLHPDIRDSVRFIDYLAQNAEGINSLDPNVIRGCMLRNALIKGHFVEVDEKESGKRVGLNFGHTFGHALETFMNGVLLKKYSDGSVVFPHGDAVGIGANFASRVSMARRSGLSAEEAIFQQRIYASLGIETAIPAEARDAFEEIFTLMAADKKSIGGIPQFVLQKRIGALQQTGDKQPDGAEAKGGYFLQPVDKETLREVFESI